MKVNRKDRIEYQRTGTIIVVTAIIMIMITQNLLGYAIRYVLRVLVPTFSITDLSCKCANEYLCTFNKCSSSVA